MANMRSFCFTIVFCNFATLGKAACLSMPKFLADHRYNEKEINRRLKKKEKDIGRSKLMATSLQPVKSWKNPVEVMKGQIFSWLSSKVLRTLLDSLIAHPHLLVWVTYERRVLALVTTNGSHCLKQH
jgi:hypothetical protein